VLFRSREYSVTALTGPAERWQEQLNASGAAGWEPLAVVSTGGEARAVFQRPASE
jgi:hypothetical protein